MNGGQTDTDENWLRYSLRGISVEDIAAQEAEHWIHIAIRHYFSVQPDEMAQQGVPADAKSGAAEL